MTTLNYVLLVLDSDTCVLNAGKYEDNNPQFKAITTQRDAYNLCIAECRRKNADGVYVDVRRMDDMARSRIRCFGPNDSAR